jgi:hypothetical protein
MKKCLGIFQICRVKAFRKPIVDRGEQVAGFGRLALLLPQAGEASRSAQLPRFRALLLGNLNGLLKTCFRFSGKRLGRPPFIITSFRVHHLTAVPL